VNNEPVAYINIEERRLQWAGPVKWDTPIIAKMDKIPLYTHPVKELTDEEIKEAKRDALKEYYSVLSYQDEFELSWIDELFARAILRKAQEK
jgi:poly-beta-hydroxyalkanoate depolymerase